ncbi:hypothetical protein RP20_CCG019061 [Aedes albopictus]|nr:hypothetical protein RP20_CCG019061 [Aedes albopictus]
MSAIDLYQQCIRIFKFNSIAVGVSLWNADQFLTIGSYSIMTQMVIYFWCNFWTVHKYRHDMLHVMEVLNSAGIAFQLSVKFFIAMYNKPIIRGLLQTVEDKLYARYPDRSSREGEIVYKFAKKCNILIKILAPLYCSSLFVFALYPLYIYYSEGRLIPLFMYEVSYVDWHTVWGYLLTNFVQIFIYVMGLNGLIMADGLVVLLALHGIVYMEVFMIHLDELAKLLQSENVIENKEKITKMWRECLSEHQTLLEYLLRLFIVNPSDALDISVVNFPWHLLDGDLQKEYLFLICRMRQPIILTVYGFSDLSLETYMSVGIIS